MTYNPADATNTQHTPAPWSVDKYTGDIVSGKDVVCIPYGMSRPDKDRAIACVNALEGIPDPTAADDAFTALRGLVAALDLRVDSPAEDRVLAWSVAISNASKAIARLDGAA